MTFILCVGSKGPNQIAKELVEREILTLTHYAYEKYNIKTGNLNLKNLYKWHIENIVQILENEVYLEYTMSFVNTSKSYKNKKRAVRPKEEQAR